MKLKILITGASGFVGYHLVRCAKSAGYEVHAAVRNSSKTFDIASYVDKFVYPDYTDVVSLKSLFAAEHYDYVIHAAALTKSKREQDMYVVNVTYTLNLMEAALNGAAVPKGIHFVSSLAALGPAAYGEDPITENSDYRPVTVYGRSKMTAELLIKERFTDKPIRIFRPTAVYGPKDKDIFILLKTLNRGIDAYIGRAPQKLSFVYVKDLAELLVDSLRIEVIDGIQAFNITDGRVYGRYDLADVFKRITGKQMRRIHIPYGIVKQVAVLSKWMYQASAKTPVLYPERLHELVAQNWSCDISRSKEQLGFEPRYGLEQGLAESIDWYRTNGWL